MKKNIYLSEFCQEFLNSSYKDNFSYEGLQILYNYFEELEKETGQEIDFDIIAICSEYSEESFEEIANSYNLDLSEYESDEEKIELVEEFLKDNGAFIGVTSEGNFVYNYAIL